MRTFLSNLLILLLLIGLIWVAVKGIAFLGSRTSTVSETIEETAGETADLLAEAKDETINKGAKVIEAIRGTASTDSTTEPTQGEESTKEESEEDNEEEEEKLPYDHDNAAKEAKAKGAIASSAVEDQEEVAEKETPISVPKANTKTAETVAPKPYESTSQSTVGEGAPYLIIAGTFGVLENAQSEVKRLQKAGYPKAEVVKFATKKFHSICINRFASKPEARKFLTKLKAKGMDAYLHLKRK